MTDLYKSLALFHYKTCDRYIYLLEKAGFVRISYVKLMIDNNLSIPVKNVEVVEVVHKIPKHLTITDAYKIAQGETWLLWFKYYPKNEGVKI